jgi:L-lactate dehydrogenase (cytochrome)
MRSELFKPIHPPNTLEKNLPPESFKGLVDPEEAAKVCRLITPASHDNG